jgi:phosphoribosylformylglycinamidine synthase
VTGTYTATVTVRLKEGVLDPEAETTRRALARLGFELDGLRAADVFEIDLDAEDADAARERAREMAERLLANPTIHDYEIGIDRADVDAAEQATADATPDE